MNKKQPQNAESNAVIQNISSSSSVSKSSSGFSSSSSPSLSNSSDLQIIESEKPQSRSDNKVNFEDGVRRIMKEEYKGNRQAMFRHKCKN